MTSRFDIAVVARQCVIAAAGAMVLVSIDNDIVAVAIGMIGAIVAIVVIVGAKQVPRPILSLPSMVAPASPLQRCGDDAATIRRW
jgi:hypothetical protein